MICIVGRFVEPSCDLLADVTSVCLELGGLYTPINIWMSKQTLLT
jgi:hypothetical protein